VTHDSASPPPPPSPDPPPVEPPPAARPDDAVHHLVTHLALVITFTIGAAVGLALGPADLRDRLPEPARSALGPTPTDLAEQRERLQHDLDDELDRLRQTGVSAVALDEYTARRHADDNWQALTQQIAQARSGRSIRLGVAMLWCLAVIVVSTAVIHRRAGIEKPADEAWHWARHAAAFAAGFLTLLYVGYFVNP